MGMQFLLDNQSVILDFVDLLCDAASLPQLVLQAKTAALAFKAAPFPPTTLHPPPPHPRFANLGCVHLQVAEHNVTH